VAFHHPVLLATKQPKVHSGSFPDDEVRPYRDAAGDSTTLEYGMHAEADVLRQIAALSPDQPRRPWFILGDPGSGKTGLLEQWFAAWPGALTQVSLGMRVPVLVPLRDVTTTDISGGREELSDRFWALGQGARAMLPDAAARIYDPMMRRLFTPVWLLDGLDEVAPELVEPILKGIINLPGLAWLVTCRRAPYELIRERTKAYAGPGQTYAGREYEILDLTPRERLQFLTGVFAGNEPRAHELVRAMIGSGALRSLAGNRSMLALIAEMSDAGELPQTRAAVVRSVIEAIWSRTLSRPEEWDLSVLRDCVLKQAAAGPEAPGEAWSDWQVVIRASEAAAPTERAQLLRNTLQRSGLLHVSLRFARFRFALPIIGAFYRADTLADERLPTVLDRLCDAPDRAEAVALLISKLFEAGQVPPLDAALDAFVQHWLGSHRRDPHDLWQRRLSPIRMILHVLQESGVPLARLARLRRRLSDMMQASAACALALANATVAPGELLADLEKSGDVAVRRAVAANRAAPAEVLGRLARDADTQVRQSVALNWGTPMLARVALASDPDDSVRLHVALSGATPEAVLVTLARDPAVVIRISLSRNPRVPPAALAVLAHDALWQIAYAALQNGRTPAQALHDLAASADPATRLLVAAHPNLPPDRALALSQDPDERIRQAVAANRSCPVALSQDLARDPSAWVRQKVAWNEVTPPEVLAQLAHDPSAAVRQVVAGNPAAPRAVADKLRDDPEIRARRPYFRSPWMVLGDATGGPAGIAFVPQPLPQLSMLGRPPLPGAPLLETEDAIPPSSPLATSLSGTAAAELDQLARSSDRGVRMNLAANRDASPEILARLATDPQPMVRQNVAGNAATDATSLMRLAGDEVPDVRRAVAQRTDAAPELLAQLARDQVEAVRLAACLNANLLIEDLCPIAAPPLP
jgi:hypothetical protein